MVISKLPDKIRLRVARNTTDEIRKIEDFLQTIKKEGKARETSAHVKTTERAQKPPFVKPPIPTPNSLSVGEIPFKWVYCKGNHYSASCEKVQDLQQCKKILFKDRWCLNCLATWPCCEHLQKFKGLSACGEQHQSICPNPLNPRNEAKSRNYKTLNCLWWFCKISWTRALLEWLPTCWPELHPTTGWHTGQNLMESNYDFCRHWEAKCYLT